MSAWRVQAPGKVNLCLFLGGTRADGRHELVTLFESLTLADELLLDIAERDEVLCPGVEGPNLVDDAIARLRDRGWDAPPVRVQITKRIPTAAGMGGGSADAAAMLRMAPEFAPVEEAVLAAVAAELGADVPSQLVPGVALGTGAGDLVSRLEPLTPHALLVLPSEHALSTAEVYREADRLELARSDQELRTLSDELLEALSCGGDMPRHLVVNDLAPAALSLCPSIAAALEAAHEVGSDDVLVCGSGPTVAGVFWGVGARELATRAASSLQSQYPGALVAQPAHAAFGLPRNA